jgi:hypothetical protein
VPHTAVRPARLRGATAALLVLGALAAGAPPAMAISGSSSHGSAAAAQYPDNDVGGRDVIGSPTGAGGAGAQGGDGGDGGDGLPFSGFAVVTLAAVGVLAAGGGLALRRTAG